MTVGKTVPVWIIPFGMFIFGNVMAFPVIFLYPSMGETNFCMLLFLLLCCWSCDRLDTQHYHLKLTLKPSSLSLSYFLKKQNSGLVCINVYYLLRDFKSQLRFQFFDAALSYSVYDLWTPGTPDLSTQLPMVISA